MKPLVSIPLALVLVLATASSLPALPEEGREDLTGEQEEMPELIPDNPLPWHDSMLELPWWMSQEQSEIEDRTRAANHGGGLFPPRVWPLQPESAPSPLVRDEAMAPTGRGPEGAPPFEATLLNSALMSLYTGEAPQQVFVDPQKLVSGRRSGEMESLVRRWLNEQCAFQTTVLIFGPGQQLPADFDPQALRRQWFGDANDDALLVFYFYRQPERTLAIFGPGARQVYQEATLRSVVDAAVTEAGRVEGGTGQLERFCYKMSVRLHWMARTRLGGGDGGDQSAVAGRSPGQTAALAGLGGLLILAVGATAFWWRRHRLPVLAKDGTILFPEWELHPRLKAPHCGGFCAVITYPRATPRS